VRSSSIPASPYFIATQVLVPLPAGHFRLALEDFGLFKVFSLETRKPKWMCLCVVKLLFPNAAKERQVMFLPFFCQKANCQIKANNLFLRVVPQVKAGLSFQV
jgi:hypothetical protein